MVNKKGTALLMVFVDIDTEQDADFNDWYNQEHVADLLALPGFLNGARYEAAKDGPLGGVSASQAGELATGRL